MAGRLQLHRHGAPLHLWPRLRYPSASSWPSLVAKARPFDPHLCKQMGLRDGVGTTTSSNWSFAQVGSAHPAFTFVSCSVVGNLLKIFFLY